MKAGVCKIAFLKTLPVMAGYVVLGTGFGILLRGAGFGAWVALAMSVFIYAGSMQYVGVGLLAGGASVLSAMLTTVITGDDLSLLFEVVMAVTEFFQSAVNEILLIIQYELASVIRDQCDICHSSIPVAVMIRAVVVAAVAVVVVPVMVAAGVRLVIQRPFCKSLCRRVRRPLGPGI